MPNPHPQLREKTLSKSSRCVWFKVENAITLSSPRHSVREQVSETQNKAIELILKLAAPVCKRISYSVSEHYHPHLFFLHFSPQNCYRSPGSQRPPSQLTTNRNIVIWVDWFILLFSLLLLLRRFSLVRLCATPIDGSPSGSPIPGILQARTLEWVAISFSNACKWKVKVKSHSRVRLLATPWTAAYQAPPSMGFSRPEYWSGVPLPSPTILSTVVYIFMYIFKL